MAPQKSSNDTLLEMFNEADKDNSKSLNRQELEQLLKKGNRNISKSQLEEVFKFFNSDSGDQVITYDEFKKGLETIAAFIEEIKQLFKHYDKDNSGSLDRNELKQVLNDSGHKFTEAEIDDIFKRADADNSKTISLAEFLNALA